MQIRGSVTIGDTEYDVEFEAENIKIGNDGIGGYEFWGFKGTDKGTDFVEEYEIGNLKIYVQQDGKELHIREKLRNRIEDKIYHSLEISRKVDEVYGEYLESLKYSL
jgi:hypothetical protein